MIAYMLTWTTYGTWLQGDLRGWVKNGKIKDSNDTLEKVNHENLKREPVYLELGQRKTVLNAIIEKSVQLNQKIFALSVCRNHVHIVAECNKIEIGKVVSYYKNAGKFALKKDGFIGNLWTTGYDKRYLDTEAQVNEKIDYVFGHSNGEVYLS